MNAQTAAVEPGAAHWTMAAGLALLAHGAVMVGYTAPEPSFELPSSSAGLGDTFLPAAELAAVQRVAIDEPPPDMAMAVSPASTVQSAREIVESATAVTAAASVVTATSPIKAAEARAVSATAIAVAQAVTAQSIEARPVAAASPVNVQAAPVTAASAVDAMQPEAASKAVSERVVQTAADPLAASAVSEASASPASEPVTVAVEAPPSPPVAPSSAVSAPVTAATAATATPVTATTVTTAAPISATTAAPVTAATTATATPAASEPVAEVSVAAEPVPSAEPAPTPTPTPTPTPAEPASTEPTVVAALPSTPAPEAATAVVDPDLVAADIAGMLGDEPCTRVEQVAGTGDGLRYAGIVPTEEDKRRILADARERAQGLDIELDLSVVGRPFCSAFIALPTAVEGRDVMELNNDDGIFLDGELLQVAIGPVPVSGHLYVTYVDHTGEVLHMLPNRFEEATAIEAGATRELGVEEGVLQVLEQLGVAVGSWRVEGPYGQGLIMAFATANPLSLHPREQQETVASFFEALQQSTDDEPVIWARYRWIDTRPQG